MSIAACLLLYGFTVAVLAPQVFEHLTDGRLTPRQALFAWLTAIGSVAASLALALVVLIIDLLSDLAHPGHMQMLHTCFSQLHDAATGRYGVLVQGGLLTLTVFAATAAAVGGGRLVWTLLRARSTTHDHARKVRMVGRHNAELDAVVLDLAEPAAYCAAGKPHTVVVTTALVAALEERHLAAVLAHERAHLAGRHHLLLAVTRGLATGFPWFRIFTVGATEVARLLEMCADDSAARAYGPDTVREALQMLAASATEPTGALAATGDSLARRVARLTAPARDTQRSRRRFGAAAALVTIVPLMATIVAAVGIAMCAQMPI
ncbi:M56 family metallopeptidase [Nocardia barduliensis]|uniref:M56 family metallopeptidase n=1 Tax=Nocardia barduliensis TaxID=2736643 RepID=UPI001571A635|nr:M56 family metallopeptidase [Nocardia barduliensis]